MGNNMKVQTETLSIPMRTHKDRVFRMIFKEQKEFLELYNAMNEIFCGRIGRRYLR